MICCDYARPKPSADKQKNAQRDGNDWRFVVSDNGLGISMKHRTRIFEMFQRLHEHGHYEGTGIGLAIVKRIVEQHGGRIWLESSVGVGTTFYFSLPAADALQQPLDRPRTVTD